MAKLGATILIALSLGLAANAESQNLDMSASDRSSSFDQAGKPTRGMTQASVEANFGSPQNSRAAVGDPPITRWEYADFVVFFEFDKVIHAVTKR
ncbi:MAG: hypothetical protein O3A13_07320 [Proteobacteria bacterium]|nr:hypothetical protein [Pseudomonadota bacterium]MDA0993429.1 hypothetical protein [Pseudomonadota bacterium]